MERSDEQTVELTLRLASADPAEVDRAITDELRRLACAAGADRAYVTLYHDDDTFEVTHEWTSDDTVPQKPAIRRLDSAAFEHTYLAAIRGEVFTAPDLSALPDGVATAERRSFSSFGVRAVLQVPIVIRGEGIGLIGINHFEPVDGWSAELVDEVGRVGRLFGVVLVQHRSAESARRAHEETRRAHRLKEQLLAHMGHEIRTPLHAILGYAELLELDDRSAADREALFQIQFQGRHLLTLVDDLVALGREGEVPTEDIPVGPVVRSVMTHLGQIADRRGIAVESADELDDLNVHGEAGRVRQIVYCLVSGAVQRLEPGSAIRLAPAPTATLRIDLRGSAPVGDDVVTPLATTLIEGHGAIETVRHDDRRVAIEVSIG